MTIWTQEDQDKILSWPYVYDIAIFKGDTKNKHIDKKGWQEENYSKADFKQRLESGLYDLGICIALGKTISRTHYTFALDFDGWDAITAWFGGDTKEETWERVKALARRTRVEWHENFEDGKIHVILKSQRLLGKNRRIHIGNALLEVRCDRQALFASPSIHKNGNRYRPLDTEDIEIICNNDLLRVQAKIDSLSKNYMSDDDREKYDNWLDLPTTILGVNQGRHDATKFKVIRYFWKYSGEWLNYSDEQRFEKAWEWHLKHCNPPRSREEFDRICKWTIDTFREERDKKHEEARSKYNNYADMPGCVSYQINSNPDKFVVSTPDNKLVETIHKYEDSDENPKEKICKVYHTRTFLCCKPVRIVKHINPLSFLDIPQKYTIEFRGSEQSGNFTLRHKSLAEIVNRLKQTEALTDRNLDAAMIAQIKGFEKAGLLEENDDIDITGFFPGSESCTSIIYSGVDIPEPGAIDTVKLRTALDFIDSLAKTAYKGRLDLLAHLLQFALIAPVSFIFKVIKSPTLEWLFFYGPPNSTKSSSGKIILAFDGHEEDDDYIVSMAQVDTLARMGDTISRTTFPTLADEMELIDKQTNRENTTLTSAIKSAVDKPIFRKVLNQSREREKIPALSGLIMTSNPPPPFQNTALIKRLAIRHHSIHETHVKGRKDAVKFDNEVLPNLHKLHVLGQFRNRFVVDNKAIILDKKLTPFQKARKILEAIYKADNNRPIPEWFDKELKQTFLQQSLTDAKDALIVAFETMIINKIKNLKGEHCI